MNLTQKIKQIKNKNPVLRRAAMIGAISLATTSVAAQEHNTPKPDEDIKNKLEVSAGEKQTSNSECAMYVNNIELNINSPIEQIYKIEDNKAFYSPYLDEGKGGIVFMQYHMSDANAFARANGVSSEKFAEVFSHFTERAKSLGYDGEIKSLEDAAQCIEKYKESNKKRDRYIGEELDRTYQEKGLFGAQQQKDFVNKLNAGNMQMAKHEQSHAQNGQYMKDIGIGNIMLTPGGIYMAHMADELQAQISGNNIEASEKGITEFFAEYGKKYYNTYTSNILEDASYKRMFAYSLNEGEGKGNISAEINNSFLDMSVSGKDNKGNLCSVNAVETSKGFIYFTGEQDATSAKVGGKTIALNCLANEQGEALKDNKGNIIPAQVIHNENGFSVSLSEKDLKTTEMDKRQEEVVKYILRHLSPEKQTLVKNALKKYCAEDANKLTQAWLQDKDSLLQIRAETGAENFSKDMEYIKSKRADTQQSLWNQKAADMELVQIVPQNGNSLQLTAEMFQTAQKTR